MNREIKRGSAGPQSVVITHSPGRTVREQGHWEPGQVALKETCLFRSWGFHVALGEA